MLSARASSFSGFSLCQVSLTLFICPQQTTYANVTRDTASKLSRTVNLVASQSYGCPVTNHKSTVCPKKVSPPNILHWQMQTCSVLNKIKHAQKYLSYCRQISYDSIIPFNRFSIFTNCCHRFQLPTWLAYYARRTSLTSRMTSFCW